MRINTSLGPVEFAGALSASKARPVLFVVRGAFTRKDDLEWLVPELAGEADVVLAHLPGMFTPTLARDGVAAIAAAFDEAMSYLLRDREVSLLGVSAGALVAIGLARAPGVRSLALVDPCLDIGACWALKEALKVLAPPDSPFLGWAQSIFGAGFEANHQGLTEGLQVPTLVLVGEEPLEPRRAFSRLPSLTSEAERELWRSKVGAEVIVCPGAGHNLPDDSRAAVLEGIRRALRAAA